MLTPPALIQQAAEQTSNPRLMLAISFVESSWRANAVGRAGEVGAMQLHPKYHNVPKTVVEQFKYAERYLMRLRKICGIKRYLACYNVGPRKIALDKTLGVGYTRKVMEAYNAIETAEARRAATQNKSTLRIAADN
jgi:hypothetical protein